MLSALRSRARSAISHNRLVFPSPSYSHFSSSPSLSPSPSSNPKNLEFLNLEEIQKVLEDVKADDVKVLPVAGQCDWTEYMVIATGRSAWHVRNIAQALIYKVKQKQIHSERKILPSVEGEEAGNWIVVDSGTVIVHALDEKARAYYNLEKLWTKEIKKEPIQDLEKAIVKTRRINNSKKPMKSA